MEHNHNSIVSRAWEKADSTGIDTSGSHNLVPPPVSDRKLSPSIHSDEPLRQDLPPTFVHVPTNHLTSGDDDNDTISQRGGGAALQLQKDARTDPSSKSDYETRRILNNGREGESSEEVYHSNISYPHLLVNETRLDKQEQFEERLRRAHLRIQNSDSGDVSHPDTPFTTAGNLVESSEKRYRSKSTPSRGAGGGMLPRRCFDERQSENDDSGINCENESSTNVQKLGDCHNGPNGETASLYPHHFSQFDAPIDLLPSKFNENDDAGINSHTETISGPPNITLDFSSKSYAGSDHDVLVEEEGQHTVLEPPPPPPLVTEKERLVERERQARLESERVRRRHLALQRERLQDEDDDDEEGASGDVIMNGSTTGGLLCQVSFDAGLQSLMLGMHNESRSSVGSSISIPIPPLPPPATERERLVERERQARLESERARRRQALLRERNQEDIGGEGENVWTEPARRDVHSAVGSDFDHGLFEMSGFASLQSHVTNGDTTQLHPPDVIRLQAQDSILPSDGEANNLSFPMERFLEKANDEESITVTADTPTVENDVALPYTMELFLAEHAIRGTQDNSGVNEANGSQMHNISATLADQESLTYDDDEDIRMNPIREHAQMTLYDTGAGRHSENSWISHPPSTSSAAHPRSQDLNGVDAIPRLTQADIAQFSEVEHASTGNAPPQSVRNEPSEPSIVGRGAFLDHAFSVATQTTVIESVTEASVCPLESAFSDINESGESVNVIRLGSAVSVSTNASDGASSASIEAVPSRASRDSSHSHSVAMSDALSHSESLASHAHCRLTEAIIMTQAEIDCASLGNTPPHSIRDDRLSESSITERVGRQSIDISTRIGEHIVVEDARMAYDAGDHDTLSNQNDTASVEAWPSVHSDHSTEVTHREHDDGIRNIREDTIMYQPSDLGSITSIEALPSIDLENEGGIHDYGLTLTEELQTPLNENFNRDIETAPLLSARSNERAYTESLPLTIQPEDSSTPREKKSMLVIMCPSLVVIIAELPAFLIISRGGDQLCSLLGVQKFQAVLASLVMTSILNHADKFCVRNGTQQLLDRSLIYEELRRCFILGIVNGFSVGLIGFFGCLDLQFGVVIALSVGVAITISKLCITSFMVLLQKLDANQLHGLIEPGTAGFIDFISCLVISKIVCIVSGWST